MKHIRISDTALIGCGYWGTNIAKVLNKIKKNKIDNNNIDPIIPCSAKNSKYI